MMKVPRRVSLADLVPLGWRSELPSPSLPSTSFASLAASDPEPMCCRHGHATEVRLAGEVAKAAREWLAAWDYAQAVPGRSPVAAWRAAQALRAAIVAYDRAVADGAL